LNLSFTHDTLTFSLRRRGSQVVRHGSAKAAFVGSIPTLASSLFVGFCEEKSGKMAEFQ
jgi:hypothetical protein